MTPYAENIFGKGDKTYSDIHNVRDKKKSLGHKIAKCNSRFCSDLSLECVESHFLPCAGYNRSRTHFTWLQTLLSSNLFSRRKPLRPSVKISNPLPSFFLTPTGSAKWLPSVVPCIRN